MAYPDNCMSTLLLAVHHSIWLYYLSQQIALIFKI